MHASVHRRLRPAKAVFLGSMILFLAGGLCLAVLAADHWRDSQRAREIRLSGSRIRIEQLEARRAEKDFLLRSLADPGYYSVGASPYLERHDALVAALAAEIRGLGACCDPAEAPAIAGIQSRVAAYASSFRSLAEACRQRGFSGGGAEGACEEALGRLKEAAERTSHPEVRLAAAALEKQHWRSLRDEGPVASQDLQAALARLRQSIASLPYGERLDEVLTVYEKRLEELSRLRDVIGRSEDEGLMGEMRAPIRALDPAVDSLIHRSATAIEEAQRQRQVILLGACGLMSVLLAVALLSARSARSRALQLLAVKEHLEGEIEERTQTVQALVERQERLLQAERLAAIGQMVTGLAHESRNALQRGQACLEMLARRVASVPGAIELVSRVQGAQDDLQRLYEEVREYAAPVQLRREEQSLDAIVERSWEKLSLRRAGREARLVQTIDVLDTRCDVDAFAVERVFRNLLENSLDACRDPVAIAVAWSEAVLKGAPVLRGTVCDNGPGVPDEARAKIFGPFYTTKTKGTGLGMAIAHRLVELHGGTIELGPAGAAGFTVIITLPRKEPT